MEIKDEKGYQPIHFAAIASTSVATKYLLSAGANESALTNYVSFRNFERRTY